MDSIDSFENFDKQLNDTYIQLVNSKDNPKEFEKNLEVLAKKYYACKNFLYSSQGANDTMVYFKYSNISEIESILTEFDYIVSPQNKFGL